MDIIERLKELPVDIQRKIWEYDDSWLRKFDMDVIPYLQQDWFIKWIELEDGKPYGKYGIDLTDDAMHKASGDFHHNYIRAKKICDERNKIKDGYIYVPSHSAIGEVDDVKGGPGSFGSRLLGKKIIYRIFPADINEPPVIMDNVYLQGIG